MSGTRGGTSEREFQSKVIQTARLYGWMCVHIPTRAVYRHGSYHYETSYEGDKGLPDLILARDGVVWLVELKTDIGRLSPDQRKWGQHLGGIWQVWRPQDWELIVATLRRATSGEDPYGREAQR